MQTICLVLVAGLLSFQQDWKEFNHPEGNFKILAPQAFTEKTDSVETALGKLAYHTYFIQTDEKLDENLFYMVSYCDYPSGVVFADSSGLTGEFFDATMEEAADAVGGKVLYSADVQLDGNPGRHWRIDYLDGKAVIKTKAFLVKNRFYSLQIIAYKEKSLNNDAERFFNSFRLLHP